MAQTEPRLRPVSALPEAPDRADGGRRPSRTVLVLGVSLAIAIFLLLWTRAEMGGRIGALEDETAALEQQVSEARSAIAARNRTIAAQGERLESVRESVRGVLELLDTPVAAAIPAD